MMTMSQPNIKLSLSRQINFQKQINNKTILLIPLVLYKPPNQYTCKQEKSHLFSFLNEMKDIGKFVHLYNCSCS